MHDSEFEPVEPTPATPRPVSAVRLTLGAIPSELKKLDRWILWKYTLVKSKWTKTPHNALTGHKCDATDFANGVSFTEAVQSLKKRKSAFDGLGFLLGKGIAGIDVDDCVDADGNLDERGAAISAQYKDTYAEISPSGQGFKILVDISADPKLAIIGKNTPETEIYGSNRYFTVTGAKLPQHAPHIAPMAQAFASTAAGLGVAPRALADMPADRPREALGVSLAEIRELFDHLPFSYVDDYGDWLKGLMAIHHETNGSSDGLALAIELSQRSTKFEEGGVEAKWGTFGRPGKVYVTMRSLVREAQATGWRAPHTIERAVQDFSAFDEPTIVIDEDGVAPEPLSWWWKYSVGEMLRLPAPHKEWVWKGVLRAGKVLVLAGSGGSSKSYLMLGAAVQYALGNDWGPFVMPEAHTPGKVLLLYGEEDKADVHDRLQALRHTFLLTAEQIDLIAERVAVLPLRGTNVELAKQDAKSQEIVITEQLERLEQRVVTYDIKFIVMDPLALLHSLEENDNNAIARFMSALDSLCMRTGCSIVLVHHFAKGGPTLAREVNESNVRGASALVAHARTVVVMHRLREDEAQSWGVQEVDHSRWVMWAIAKNNYGPSGGRYWFNVDEHTGAITPAPHQLEYVNSRDLRAAALAHQNETLDNEITATAARVAREAAERLIELTACKRVLLRWCKDHGDVPKVKDSVQILRDGGFPNAPNRRGRDTLEILRNDELIHPDGILTEKGETWLLDQEWLAGV